MVCYAIFITIFKLKIKTIIYKREIRNEIIIRDEKDDEFNHDSLLNPN